MCIRDRTDIYSFEGKVTYEDRTGRPIEANDWVVCSRYDGPDRVHGTSEGIGSGPNSVTGNITIHIIPSGSNTSLSVYLVNLKAGPFDAKSTGILERQFIDILSKK